MYPPSFEYYKVADLVDTQNNLARSAIIYKFITTMKYDIDAEPFTQTRYLVDTFAWAIPSVDPYLIRSGYVWYSTRKFGSLPEALAFARKQFNIRYYNTSYRW